MKISNTCPFCNTIFINKKVGYYHSFWCDNKQCFLNKIKFYGEFGESSPDFCYYINLKINEETIFLFPHMDYETTSIVYKDTKIKLKRQIKMEVYLFFLTGLQKTLN